MKLFASVVFASLLSAATLAFAAPEPFAVATFDVGDVELYKEQGPCEGNANMAIGHKKDGSKDTGCWVPNGPYVQVAWLDGAVDRIPFKAFKEPV
jgi:hypothetical protein